MPSAHPAVLRKLDRLPSPAALYFYSPSSPPHTHRPGSSLKFFLHPHRAALTLIFSLPHPTQCSPHSSPSPLPDSNPPFLPSTVAAKHGHYGQHARLLMAFCNLVANDCRQTGTKGWGSAVGTRLATGLELQNGGPEGKSGRAKDASMGRPVCAQQGELWLELVHT